MKPIRIFRHQDWIGAGHLTEVLSRRAIPYEFVCIDAGDSVPETLTEVSGLVFLGGTMSVNDDFPWIEDELRLIRTAADSGIPILGHCLGSQLISKALGGAVVQMPQKEIGWHTVRKLANREADRWLGDVPEANDVLLWHHDRFSIPDGAVPLLESRFCADQAFVMHGNIVATVAHLEVTVEMLSDWLDVYGYDVAPVSDSVQSIAQIRDAMDVKVTRMQRLTDRLYDQWLEIVSGS